MRALAIRRLADAAVVILFLIAIAAPLAAQVAGLGQGTPGRENRRLAGFPTLGSGRASLATFPGGVRVWYEHRFGLREPLVRWHNRLKAAIGVSGVDRVLLGKAGWLFLNRDGRVIEQYRGLAPLDPLQLDAWRASLADREAWLRARGIHYLVVLVPEKHTVYPEYLPERITRVRPDTPVDQLLEHLTRRGSASMLDLRPALARAKGGPLLYEKADTHWSALGAFVAYQEIVTALAERTARPMVPKRLEAFRLVRREGPGGDLARMLALEDVYREDRLALVPVVRGRTREVPATVRARRGVRTFETGDARLPRAVVFHDSFAHALMPYLSEHFERITYARQFAFSAAVVEAERPDVVIHEIAERWIVSTPRDEPPVLGAAERALSR